MIIDFKLMNRVLLANSGYVFWTYNYVTGRWMEGYSNYVNAIIELLHLCTPNFRDRSLNIMESLNWVLTKRLVMALVQPSSLIDSVVNYLYRITTPTSFLLFKIYLY